MGRKQISNTEKSSKISTLTKRFPSRSLNASGLNDCEKDSFKEINFNTLKHSSNNRTNIMGCSKMTPLLSWIILFAAILTVFLRSAIPIYLNAADEKFLEIRKCPACYGVVLCPAFLTGEIEPENWSRFTATQAVNAKNVFYATFKGKHVSLKAC